MPVSFRHERSLLFHVSAGSGGGFIIPAPRGKGKEEPRFFPKSHRFFTGKAKRLVPAPGKKRIFLKLGLDAGRENWYHIPCYGGIAQLVRAPASHVGGHRFESCCPHQAAPGRTSRPRRSFFFYPNGSRLWQGCEFRGCETRRLVPAPPRAAACRGGLPFSKGGAFPTGKPGRAAPAASSQTARKRESVFSPAPSCRRQKSFAFSGILCYNTSNHGPLGRFAPLSLLRRGKELCHAYH